MRPSPRAHWALLALGMLVLLGALLLDALVVQKVGQGEAPTAGPHGTVPAEISTGGPLIGSDGAKLTSRRAPDRTVVLTFDDGPDPVWTPKIVEVLRRNGVKATARAWTEAPASLGQLWRQRYRWCYGTLQAMWKHRGALFERGLGGKLGRRGLPYLFLYQVVLPVLAPAIDVFALLSLFTAPARGFVAWFGFLALQLIPAVIAFRLDRESMRPLWAVALQPIVYRQLMYLVVIQSVITAVAGARLPWQKLKRMGAAAQNAPELAEEKTASIR